jgi:hypothetical protein
MFRFILSCCCLCLLGIAAHAQTVIKGRVMEDKTRIPLAGVHIDNLSTKQSALSDNKGDFSIKAEPNQLLVFKVFAYEPDTLLVTTRASIEVFLTLQSHTLKSVNVTTTETKNSFKIYDPNFHGQAVNYQTDASGRPIGGINLRMWYWKKDEHRRKRLQQEEKDEQIEDQIFAAFAPENIAKYVPLKGDEMTHFIMLYIPSIEQWQSPNFNMLSYLDGCYKKFSKLSPEERMKIDSL